MKLSFHRIHNEQRLFSTGSCVLPAVILGKVLINFQKNGWSPLNAPRQAAQAADYIGTRPTSSCMRSVTLEPINITTHAAGRPCSGTRSHDADTTLPHNHPIEIDVAVEMSGRGKVVPT